ncbi:MAG: PQQ-dependent sugar dehydrogenase [Acidimicrobiales bacterium]|nr:PQQ-dependent sugar dehydrogenase [Acidimicrobiales bacterium]
MRLRSLIAGVLALGLVASACGEDNALDPSTGTTLPVVTDPPDETTSTTTTTTEPAAADGDISQAAVSLTTLGNYTEPVDTAVAPNGELWLAEREGLISVLDPVTGELSDAIVDITTETVAGGERGLLGLAVDGDNLYVNFTDLDGHTNVDAFVLDDDGHPGERHHLLLIEQPFGNHNGGGLAIGPDGHLYIGVGDGGLAADPLGAGQDPTQILGSILRIDPTPGGETPYAIPADNPYADGANGRPEIFMIGARNPWRFSFDPVTDDLWIADVGQNLWEEVDLMLGANGWGLGGNLGWNLREGTHEFGGPKPDGNIDPVFEYPHRGASPSGCSISGGVVYRGTAIPDLVGAYAFGDYCNSTVWAISTSTGEVVFADLGGEVDELVGITADADGELLALTLSGNIERIVPA